MHTNQLKRFLSPSWNENNCYIVTSQSVSRPKSYTVSKLHSTNVYVVGRSFVWLTTSVSSCETYQTIDHVTLHIFLFSFHQPPTIKNPKRFVIILKFNRSANIKWIGHNFTPPNRTLFACNWICSPIIYPNSRHEIAIGTTIRFWNVVNLHLCIIICHDGIA